MSATLPELTIGLCTHATRSTITVTPLTPGVHSPTSYEVHHHTGVGIQLSGVVQHDPAAGTDLLALKALEVVVLVP